MTRLKTDTEMIRAREAGELECRCPAPRPMYIGAFSAWQCDYCMRPIRALRHSHQQG